MPEAKELQGQCMCGAVRLTASRAGNRVGACHCGMCRRWGDGPFMAVDCGADVVVDGEEYVGIFDSSNWAERGFCRECGTHLFYRLKEVRQHMIPVGLLDEDKSRVFERQVFVDERPDYYCFADKTKELTGAQLFAKYAPPQ